MKLTDKQKRDEAVQKIKELEQVIAELDSRIITLDMIKPGAVFLYVSPMSGIAAKDSVTLIKTTDDRFLLGGCRYNPFYGYDSPPRTVIEMLDYLSDGHEYLGMSVVTVVKNSHLL